MTKYQFTGEILENPKKGKIIKIALIQLLRDSTLFCGISFQPYVHVFACVWVWVDIFVCMRVLYVYV